MSTHFLVAVALAMLCVISDASAADATAERLRDALRKSRDDVRKLEQERADWLKEKADLDRARGEADARGASASAQIDTIKRTLVAEQARAAELSRQLERLQQDLAEARRARGVLDEQIKGARADAAKHGAAYKEASVALQAQMAAGEQARARLARTERDLNSCERDNAGLYQIAVDVAEKSTGLSYWDGVLKREPLFQLKRVELESLMENYRDRIEKQRREAAAPHPVAR